MDDSESSLPDLKALSLSVSFPGWRKATPAFKSWAINMSSLHRPTWQKAGIFEAVIASMKVFDKNKDLVLGISERWCPDTKTFLFPWGEATVTLEDVMVLLGFSVLGSPVFAPLDGSGEKTVRELGKEWLKIKKDNNVSFVTQVTWTGRFMGSGDELEHAAFLALWLSYFVFPTKYSHLVRPVLPIAVHLSRGTRIALAPPVLAHLYEELTLLKDHIRGFNMAIGVNTKLELSSLFKLVQVWTWERFRELRPNNSNLLLQGEPRLALWDEEKLTRTRSTVRKSTKNIVRKILANSTMDSFEWRPYTKAVKNWTFPLFYPEEAMWVPVGPDLDEELISFARCVKVSELIGIHSVEHYFPNRVASQFGLLQDVPCPVNMNNLFKEAAWDEYSKPIDGLRLYIPSRSSVSCFTSMFCEWWRKNNRAAESLTPRNIIGDGDDDTSEPVPSCSKKQKSMKRVCKDSESHMVPSEKDEEDDSLTIAQVMSLRKKNKAMCCSSDENHSLDPPHKALPLREVLQKLGKEFPEKLKRSRDLRTPTDVRCEIADSGGSASREAPLNELFQKEEVVKRKTEHMGDMRAPNITTAEMVIDKEKSVRDDSLTIAKKNTIMCSSDENHSLDPPPKVLPLREAVQKLGKEFPAELKRSRYLRTPTNVRSEISDSGGSASREVPLNELCQTEVELKRKSEHLGDNQAREMVIDREKGVRDASKSLGKRNNRLEADNKDSWICQKVAHEDETVAPLKIKKRSEEEKTGNKAVKNTVLRSASGNNSSDPPLGANGVADCNDEVDVNGIKAEKKKTVVGDGTKGAKCLVHENGENQRSNEKEDVDESLKQKDLAIDELALSLEARMMKVEKTLAKIREWKTIERNQARNVITV
ncbi:Uncharacterized protein Rs2_03320 [Raphanus sativus]|uniref:Uncharacterized protein LOC108849393 n=1 Tax=Raphanus sativus TaxID=3726 RepID=A0A6J0N191_RAPSA|nr:uncharacterized protein LOC108849393 [Raphanus sativus]KAJ4917770.1 Uncharacterized protein Rs2_03320 [Raphanus sativus]